MIAFLNNIQRRFLSFVGPRVLISCLTISVSLLLLPRAVFAFDPIISGGSQTIADTDGAPGESVSFSATPSFDDEISSMEWAVGGSPAGSGTSLSVFLGDGSHDVSVTINYTNGNMEGETVFITVTRPSDSGSGSGPGAPEEPEANVPPTVSISGATKKIDDSDDSAGESITLNAVAEDIDGSIIRYQWTLNGSPAGSSSSVRLALADGDNTVSVEVTDDSGATASEQIEIAVRKAGEKNKPPVIAGLTYDKSLAYEESIDGAEALLTVEASDSDGTIVTTLWTVNGSAELRGASVTTTLSDRFNAVTLRITDDEGAETRRDFTIEVAERPNSPPQVRTLAYRSTYPDSDWKHSESVNIVAHVSDADGDKLTAKWYYPFPYGAEGLNQSYRVNTDATIDKQGMVKFSREIPLGKRRVTLIVTDERGAETTVDYSVLIQGPDELASPLKNIQNNNAENSAEISWALATEDREVISEFKNDQTVYIVISMKIPKVERWSSLSAAAYIVGPKDNPQQPSRFYAIVNEGKLLAWDPSLSDKPETFLTFNHLNEATIYYTQKLNQELPLGEYSAVVGFVDDNGTVVSAETENFYVTGRPPQLLRQLTDSRDGSTDGRVFEGGHWNKNGQTKLIYKSSETPITVKLRYVPSASHVGKSGQPRIIRSWGGSLYERHVTALGTGWFELGREEFELDNYKLPRVDDFEFKISGVTGTEEFYIGYDRGNELFYASEPLKFTIEN